MDLNGDGILDVISGQYAPGRVNFFEGTKSGYKKPVLIHEDVIMSASDLDTLMATANFVDWDGDGDYDMILGNVKGAVYVNFNEGTATSFKFRKRRPVLAAGKPMIVALKSDPLPVDWNQDGVLDLLVGDEAGDITFFRGKADRTFEQGISLFTGKLLDRADYNAAKEALGDDRPVPGYRLRLAVADWNNDGRLDLLVGNCIALGGRTTSGHVRLFLRE